MSRAGDLAVELEPEGALSGDDLRVVIRRDVGLVAGRREGTGGGFSLGAILPGRTDLDAAFLEKSYLAGLGGRRGEDGDSGVDESRSVRHGQAMVAGRGGHQAALTRLVVASQHSVECAAQLEGAGELMILEL